MGTSFFTPLWQIECTSLATTAITENDNFLCGISELCPQTLRSKKKCLFPLPCEKNLFLCLQLPTQALYSFSQLLARCSKDQGHGNSFFHTAVANRMHVHGDNSYKGKRQFPLPAEKSYVTFEMCRSTLAARKYFQTTSSFVPPATSLDNRTLVTQVFG